MPPTAKNGLVAAKKESSDSSDDESSDSDDENVSIWIFASIIFSCCY